MTIGHLSLGFGKFGVAPVAQLDRAAGFEPAGREFDPLRARQTGGSPNDQLPTTEVAFRLVIGIWTLVIAERGACSSVDRATAF